MPRFDSQDNAARHLSHTTAFRRIGNNQQPENQDAGKSIGETFNGGFVAVIDAIRSLETSLSQPKVAPTALGLDAAAEYLGIKPNRLEYLVRTRKIRYVQVGVQRGRVFRITDLDEFLEENTQLTANEMFRRTGRK